MHGTDEVHIITDLGIGGAETMLCNYISEKVHDRRIAVISLGRNLDLSARIEAAGISLYCIGMPKGRPTLPSLWRFVRILLRLRPHRLIGWLYHGCLAAEFGSLLTGADTIWNIRQSLDFAVEKKSTQLIIKALSWLSRRPLVITYNSMTAIEHHGKHGFAKENSEFVPNGFDLSKFRPSLSARERVRDEFGLELSSYIVGHVAGIKPYKDHATMIHAAARVVNLHKNVHFLVIGTGPNELVRNLQTDIDRIRLSTHIHLLGERDDIASLTPAFDVAISSSSSTEGFSNALGEAMACGVPCVTTNIGDAKRIVGDYGIVVPSKSPERLAEGIVRYIELPKCKKEILSKQCRDRIIQNFSLPSVSRRLAEVFSRPSRR
jgi:glycosyltransferase involved in cell wall biosynthesis